MIPLAIIQSPSGLGKTNAALHQAVKALHVNSRATVFFVSLEIPAAIIFERFKIIATAFIHEAKQQYPDVDEMLARLIVIESRIDLPLPTINHNGQHSIIIDMPDVLGIHADSIKTMVANGSHVIVTTQLPRPITLSYALTDQAVSILANQWSSKLGIDVDLIVRNNDGPWLQYNTLHNSDRWLEEYFTKLRQRVQEVKDGKILTIPRSITSADQFFEWLHNHETAQTFKNK
jgi:hypothetical protein